MAVAALSERPGPAAKQLAAVVRARAAAAVRSERRNARVGRRPRRPHDGTPTDRFPDETATRLFEIASFFFFFPDRALCTTESTNGPEIYTGGYFVEFSATNASGTPDDDEIRTVRLANTDRIRRKLRLARDAHLRRLVSPVEENRGQTELENRIRWKGNAVRRSTVSRSVPRLSRTRMGTANRAHI